MYMYMYTYVDMYATCSCSSYYLPISGLLEGRHLTVPVSTCESNTDLSLTHRDQAKTHGFMSIYIHMCIYMYTYVHVYGYVYICVHYMYLYI